jgi:hypothetical protein
VRTCTNVTSEAPVADDTLFRARRSSLDGLLREVFPMARMRTILASLAAGIFLFALAAQGQDEPPSLGDVARQARQQKQQKDAGKDAAAKDPSSKDTQSKDAAPKDAAAKDAPPKDALAKDAQAPKTKKVITNDEIPEHIGPTRTLPAKQATADYAPPPTYDGNPPAEYWKSRIQGQKNYLVSLQNQISELANSIQFAGGSCVSNCVQWNEQQLRKQEQLESMKAQLEQQQKSLEEFQDAARKQGFGSSVYDP